MGRNRAAATGFMSGQCVPSMKVRLSGTTVAGYLDRGSGENTACAMALRGRTVLVIAAGARGAKASTVVLHLLTVSTGGEELPIVPANATNQQLGTFIATDTVTVYNTSLMVIIVSFSVLLGLVTAVRDRSSWRRLRSRLSVLRHAQRILGRDRTLGTVTVDPLVVVRIARLSALALARVAVIVWSIRLCEHWDLDVRATAGVAAATIAGILAVGRLIRRRRARLLASRSLHGAALDHRCSRPGTLGRHRGRGVFLVANGLATAAADTAPGGVSDYVAGEIGGVLPYLGVVLIALALLPFFFARRLGMRALRNEAARERNADQERHPVLMLRSFADDQRLLRSRRTDRASIVERLCLRRFERFEEVAAATQFAYGPVLALSQPKEKLPPPLGAVRRTFSMEDWQDRIRDLISSARLIYPRSASRSPCCGRSARSAPRGHWTGRFPCCRPPGRLSSVGGCSYWPSRSASTTHRWT